ncbi:enoyl-CoA hydratase/isomerase family protein [Hydrocarboniphaga effusa]|jgi:2-(1,2-epoxy-1,2-dihydrophenyl)acetyl-CoA isomerase|uniref:enoyl-CoA hydratase/isomerase family protein n=1 Tax=Hydrocarboniphaga effusa TaxID=243629 RepID=UPI00313789DB
MSAEPAALKFERQGSIARLVLDRPAAGNAIDLDMAAALLDAAQRCEADASIRCVVLTGAGRMFCAGGDITAFSAAGEAIPEFLRELATTLHEALMQLARMRKPLITVVNGPAAGAGLSLALIGDLVLAARSAHFSAAYGSLGLTPDGGMSWWLPRVVGLRRAQEIILTGRRVGAEEAAALGLATLVVDDAALAEQAQAYAQRLAQAPTAAVGAARRLLIEGATRSLGDQLDAEVESIVAAGASAECREGVAAFLQKRKPDFIGSR